MFANWLPPYPLTTAIVSSCAIPALLVLLGRGPPALRAPGLRFRVSLGAAWLLLLASLIVFALTGVTVDIIDGLAAVATVASASILAFVGWSLIAWGFTLNMLLVLAGGKGAIGLADWIRGYTGSADFLLLTADRASILLRARLTVAVGGDAYRLTRRGRVAAVLLRFGRWVFGVRSAQWQSPA